MNVFGMNEAQRQYLYRIVIAAIPILLLLKFVTPDQVQIYLEMAAAILGLGTTATAGRALTRQREDGILP